MSPAFDVGEAFAFEAKNGPGFCSRWNLYHCFPINRGNFQFATDRGFWIADLGLVENIVSVSFEIFVGFEMDTDIQVSGASSLGHVSFAAKS